MLDARVRSKAGEVVLIVAGKIDLSTVAEFEAAMRSAGGAKSTLVVDLSGVSYMDSSGLRVLIAASNFRGPQRKIHLRGASDQVRRLLALTRLDTSIIFDDGVSETAEEAMP